MILLFVNKMAIIVNVNGNKSVGTPQPGQGEGFLIAPVGPPVDGGKAFPVPLGLSTNDGTSVKVSVGCSPNVAQVQFLPAGSVFPSGTDLFFDWSNIPDITITPVEKFVNIWAQRSSTSRNDTVIQITQAGVVQASFQLTAITHPQVWFRGRFQARLAVDNDFYNEKRGTSAGWNFTLEGEPDFVPADSVPTDINKAVGREIHFNNPAVALRTHVPPIGVHVISIKGQAGPSIEEFLVGDPIIRQQVDLGPHTYFAANEAQNTPIDPAPAETYLPGFEPLGLFEFHIGVALSGKSHNPQDRPSANGEINLTAEEIAMYGIVDSTTFANARKNTLLDDYRALSPADRTGTVAGRNLAKRIAHLGGSPPDGIEPAIPGVPVDIGNQGWTMKEEFRGLINDSLGIQPSILSYSAGINSPPILSSVLSYFAGINSLNFLGRFFNYHADEQCGQIHGAVWAGPAVGETVPVIRGEIRGLRRR
jgi:hypothetical protein